MNDKLKRTANIAAYILLIMAGICITVYLIMDLLPSKNDTEVREAGVFGTDSSANGEYYYEEDNSGIEGMYAEHFVILYDAEEFFDYIPFKAMGSIYDEMCNFLLNDIGLQDAMYECRMIPGTLVKDISYPYFRFTVNEITREFGVSYDPEKNQYKFYKY